MQRNFSTKLFSKARGVLAVAVILSAFFHFTGGSAFAQSAKPPTEPQLTQFGSWTKVCFTPPGTPTQRCELVQSMRGKDRPDIAVRISFAKLPKRQETLMIVTAPIRVELQLHVGLTIDNKDMGQMMYRRCMGENCFAEALLDQKTMQTFFDGKKATVLIYLTPEEGIGSVFELDGLKAGYNALP